MATEQTTPIIKVKLPSGEYECRGTVAKIIAYLAEHEKFFNDPRTTGNVILSLKQGDLQIKNELAALI